MVQYATTVIRTSTGSDGLATTDTSIETTAIAAVSTDSSSASNNSNEHLIIVLSFAAGIPSLLILILAIVWCLRPKKPKQQIVYEPALPIQAIPQQFYGNAALGYLPPPNGRTPLAISGPTT